MSDNISFDEKQQKLITDKARNCAKYFTHYGSKMVV